MMSVRLFFNIYYNYRLKQIVKKLKSVGKLVEINNTAIVHYPDRVSIGSYVYIGPNAEINGLGNVNIGSGVVIGPNLVLHSANHNYKAAKYIPYDETFDFKGVTVGENVWIGGNVIITPGSVIGEGAIIGAGAVVSGNIPPLAIVIGNPCKVIKYRDSDHYFSLKQNNQIYIKIKKEKKIMPEERIKI